MPTGVPHGEWVWPRGWESQDKPTSSVAGAPSVAATEGMGTPTGVVGSAHQAMVDPTGLVTPWPGAWSLDWWVGADDRWHLPSRDGGVRQRVVDASPVIETAMRIPGGDAIQRAYAVAGRHDLVVVEIENRSSVPFAVALAVRPYNPEGLVAIERISLQDRTVLVNGEPALLLPKRPPAVAGSTGQGGDCVHVVTSGRAGSDLVPVACSSGLGQAAFVFPLAHTATLRVAIPLDQPRRPQRRRSSGPQDEMPIIEGPLPSGAEVARGWAAQTRRGLRLDLPEGTLAEAVETNRKYLLLGQHDARSGRVEQGDRSTWVRDLADKAVALDQYGFHREAADVISHLRSPRRFAGLLGQRLDRGSRDAVSFALAEHGRLTGDLDNIDVSAVDSVSEAGGRALERIQLMVEAASETYTWPGALRFGEGPSQARFQFLTLVRNLLVCEVQGGLALLSSIPAHWRGQPLEVHDAPTHSGHLSFALRWHGPRPALLWELSPHSAVSQTRFTAPGLDPGWSSTELRGEALLESVEDEAERR